MKNYEDELTLEEKKLFIEMYKEFSFKNKMRFGLLISFIYCYLTTKF